MYIQRIKFILTIVSIVLFSNNLDLIEAAKSIASKSHPSHHIVRKNLRSIEYNNPKTQHTTKLKHRSHKGMQRRFMWDDMDMLYDGAMSGARFMKQMISDAFSDPTPELFKYSNPMDYLLPDSTNRHRFVLKKPLNHLKKMVKAPEKHQPKPVSQASSVTHKRQPHIIKEHTEPEMLPDFMPSEELRKLELEQERRVEASLSGMLAIDNGDVVNGQIQEFDESWKPLRSSEPEVISTTEKPYPVSVLHTDTKEFSEPNHPNSLFTYEVTENTPEESMFRPQAVRPQTKFIPYNPFKVISTTTTSTTEGPNYPPYFMKNLKHLAESGSTTPSPKNYDDTYVSKRGPSFHYNHNQNTYPTYEPIPSIPSNPTPTESRAQRLSLKLPKNNIVTTTQRAYSQTMIPFVPKTVKQDPIHIEKKKRVPHYSRLEERPTKSSFLSENNRNRGAIKFGDRVEFT